MPRNHYRLSFADLHTHLCDVEVRFAEAELEGDLLLLKMAAWTPGSYLIREYSRHVQDVSAADETGAPLPVDKVDKLTWRVRRRDAREVLVRYRVYANELTVRTSHIDATHVFLNGAPTVLWLESRRDEPAEVVVEAPKGWHVVTQLAGEAPVFQAESLDDLIDSPLHIQAEPPVQFDAAGRPVELSVWGRFDGNADVPRLLADVQRIVETHAARFGGVPYERYSFLLMVAPKAYGGLEHKRSASLLFNPFAFASRKAYEELLELFSHEYFHLWNVKRIHPAALGPFAYDREVYTRSLWVMEGVTSYIDRYTVRRAGGMSTQSYLARLAEDWAKLLGIPGRKKQSIADSSFDAWIKLYRPDENSVNTTVSYYLKGSLVMLCLDLEVRRRSRGERTLDDVLRHLWERYGRDEKGFGDDDIAGEFAEAVGLDLSEFFARYVEGTEDPDLAGCLAWAGLELKGSWQRQGDPSADAPAWLGVTTRTEGERVVVQSALAGGPAEAAGLYANDQLLALDGFRLEPGELAKRLEARRPDDRARLTVFRKDELREVEVVLGTRPCDKFEIVPRSDASADEKALYEAWLGDRFPEAG